jgi:single-stranded-DNA-specific exonuclease
VWPLKQVDESQVDRLEAELGVPRSMARVIWLRGIRGVEDARRWLTVSVDQLHEPSLLPDFEPAASRVKEAADRGETVLVWGHDDLDGITACAVLRRVLEELGAHALHHIPVKGRDKYGLNPEVCRKFGDRGVRLVLTVDCGITNRAEVAELKQAGFDVIITDHHEVTGELPPAIANVNPKRPDSGYPYRGLAGAGVALKFGMGLMQKLRGTSIQQFAEKDPDTCALAVLGTIGDRVPLTGENRVLVGFGMKCLEKTRLPAVRAVLGRLGDGQKLTVMRMVKGLLPLFAAADSTEGVDKILTQDWDEAHAWLDELLLRARQWREDAERSYDLAEKFLQVTDDIVLVCSEELSLRALGYCAGRLKEQYRVPALVLGWRGDAWVGECRGVEGMSLLDLLGVHSDLLMDFGGHRQAGGFTIGDDKVEEFIERVQKYASGHYAGLLGEEPGPMADAVLHLTDLEPGYRQLGPFGEGNPMPVFISEPTKVERRVSGLVPAVRSDIVMAQGKADLVLGSGEVRLLYQMDEDGSLIAIGSERAAASDA